MPVLTKPSACSACPLSPSSLGFSSLEGSGSNKVLILGDNLDEDGRMEGLPFRPYSQSGSILDRAIMSLGETRSNFGITNIIRCQPLGSDIENHDLEPLAIAKCEKFFAEAIDYYKPKVIVALGNVPIKFLTGLSGKKRNVAALRGMPLWSDKYSIPVIPAYHPQFIARGKKAYIGLLTRDLMRATRIASGVMKYGEHYFSNPQQEYLHEYIFSAPLVHLRLVWQWLLDHPQHPIAFDIETVTSTKEDDETEVTSEVTTITQFQISLRKHHARVISATDVQFDDPDIRFTPYQYFCSTIQQFMSLPNPKLSWNGRAFDIPVLAANHINTVPIHLDLMTLFHHWQPDIPAGLQNAASIFHFPFAWKHLASDSLEFYGGADVDSLHYIFQPLVNIMNQEGILGDFANLVGEVAYSSDPL